MSVSLSICVCVCVVNNQALPFVTCCQGPRGGRGRTGAHAAPPPCNLSPACLSFLPLSFPRFAVYVYCRPLPAALSCVCMSVVVGVFQESLVETWVAGIPQVVLPLSHSDVN